MGAKLRKIDGLRASLRLEIRSYKMMFVCLALATAILYTFRAGSAYLNDQIQSAGLLALAAGLLLLAPAFVGKGQRYRLLSFLCAFAIMSIEASLPVLAYNNYTMFLSLIPLSIVFVSFMSGIGYGVSIAILATMEGIFLAHFTHSHNVGLEGPLGSSNLSSRFFSYLIGVELFIIVILTFFQVLLSQSEDELHARRLMRARSIRRAAMTEVMGKLTHEVNNPLAIVEAAFLLFRKERTKRNPPTQSAQLMGFLEDGLSRLQNVAYSLRTFAEGDLVVPSMDIACAEILRQLRLQTSEQVRSAGAMIRWELPPERLRVTCRPKQILFVLSVFVENALDSARGESKPIIVRALRDGRFHRFEVEDEGCGMSDDIAERIFQPFVTTKAFGESMGVNLSICRGIIEEQGGRIDFLRKEAGALFWIELPAHDGTEA